MKRIVTFFLTFTLIVSLFSCERSTVSAEYTEEGKKPSYMAKLYSDPRNTEYAFVIREMGQMQSSIAIGNIGGELKTFYTAPSDCCIYEIYTGNGIVAFYELYPDSSGSVRYELKIVDTENEKIYAPYSKLLSKENDVQPRFLTVYNDCIYYLTVSLLLESCRVMKFRLSTEELTEFVSYPMTDNEFTYGHSSTFINHRGDDLFVSRVDKTTQYIDVYSLSSGEKSSEIKLPNEIGIVYNCDYDPKNGVCAIYYNQLSNGTLAGDAVGILYRGETKIKRIFTAGAGTYLDRDALRIENNILLFNLSKDAETVEYGNYDGVLYNMANDKITRFEGSVNTWYDNGSIYNLTLDKKLNGGKMTVTCREIVTQ